MTCLALRIIMKLLSALWCVLKQWLSDLIIALIKT